MKKQFTFLVIIGLSITALIPIIDAIRYQYFVLAPLRTIMTIAAPLCMIPFFVQLYKNQS